MDTFQRPAFYLLLCDGSICCRRWLPEIDGQPILLATGSQLSNESFNVKSLNPASDRCRR